MIVTDGIGIAIAIGRGGDLGRVAGRETEIAGEDPAQEIEIANVTITGRGRIVTENGIGIETEDPKRTKVEATRIPCRSKKRISSEHRLVCPR